MRRFRIGGGLALILRHYQNIMKYVLAFVVLTLLLTGCSRDARLARKIAGTWQVDSTMTEEFKPDGSFLFSSRHSNQTNNYMGKWQIRDEFMILTLTNSSGPKPDGHSGDTVRFQIIHIDAHHLTCVMGRQTNTISR